jgi:hypothetical protein
MPETERRANHPGVPNRSLINQLFDFSGARVETVHECLHQEDAFVPRGQRHCPSFRGIQSQRFFAQHMLSGLYGSERPF